MYIKLQYCRGIGLGCWNKYITIPNWKRDSSEAMMQGQPWPTKSMKFNIRSLMMLKAAFQYVRRDGNGRIDMAMDLNDFAEGWFHISIKTEDGQDFGDISVVVHTDLRSSMCDISCFIYEWYSSGSLDAPDNLEHCIKPRIVRAGCHWTEQGVWSGIQWCCCR